MNGQSMGIVESVSRQFKDGSEEQARQASGAGAQFLISPNLDLKTIAKQDQSLGEITARACTLRDAWERGKHA